MIFLTVGTQLPFDRLVKTIDTFCAEHSEIELFAQIGNGEYKPRCFEAREQLSIAEFDQMFERASLVISHAGIGSILTALSNAKPVLIMPRRADLNEHRNDHQLATAKQFFNKNGCFVFNDLNELCSQYEVAMKYKGAERIDKFAPEEMIDKLKKIVSF
jgi:exopolysaccharide biosynthesis glucuronosyltransferase PssE